MHEKVPCNIPVLGTYPARVRQVFLEVPMLHRTRHLEKPSTLAGPLINQVPITITPILRGFLGPAFGEADVVASVLLNKNQNNCVDAH